MAKSLFIVSSFILISILLIPISHAQEKPETQICTIKNDDLVIPLDIKWINEKPYFCFKVKDGGESSRLEIWAEKEANKWEKIAEINNITDMPRFVEIPGGLGIFTQIRQEKEYRTIYYKLSNDKLEEVACIRTEEFKNFTRKSMIQGVFAENNNFFVFYRTDKTLKMIKSTDSGITWNSETIIDTESSWISASFYINNNFFVTATPPKPMASAFLMRSNNAWQKEPLIINDDKDKKASRIPVRFFVIGKKLTYMVYCIPTKEGRTGVMGFYYITSSDNNGKSWKKGTAISEEVFIGEETDLLFRMAITEKGHLLVTFIKSLEFVIKPDHSREIIIKSSFLYSKNGGKNWAKYEIDIEKNETIIISTSPDKKRILLGGTYHTEIENNKVYTLFVKELAMQKN